MVRGIQNISASAINAYSMAQGRKMSFHVNPSSLIYSNFEHVTGVAAPNGTQGVAINKLKLLDVLISQLNQARRESIPSGQAVPKEQMDALIESYRNQIQQARAASAVMPYIPSPSAQSGAVFSLVA